MSSRSACVNLVLISIDEIIAPISGPRSQTSAAAVAALYELRPAVTDRRYKGEIGPLLLRRTLRAGGARQIDDEPRAPSGLRLNPDVTPVSFDHLVDDGQTQARAVREARLEGFKELLGLLSCEPDTCVGQGYSDVACAARLAAIRASLLEPGGERSSLGH